MPIARTSLWRALDHFVCLDDDHPQDPSVDFVFRFIRKMSLNYYSFYDMPHVMIYVFEDAVLDDFVVVVGNVCLVEVCATISFFRRCGDTDI